MASWYSLHRTQLWQGAHRQPSRWSRAIRSSAYQSETQLGLSSWQGRTAAPQHRQVTNDSQGSLQQAQRREEAIGVVVLDMGCQQSADLSDLLVEFGSTYMRSSRRDLVAVAHAEGGSGATLDEAVHGCLQRGAVGVVIVPYFLARSRKSQCSMAALVSEVQQRMPRLASCVIAEPIGVDSILAQLIESRVAALEAGPAQEEAVAERAWGEGEAAQQTLLGGDVAERGWAGLLGE